MCGERADAGMLLDNLPEGHLHAETALYSLSDLVRKSESKPNSRKEASKDSGPVAIPLSSSNRLATIG